MKDYSKEAEKLARRDVNKMDVQTTSEGKGLLRGRYIHWLKVLKERDRKNDKKGGGE